MKIRFYLLICCIHLLGIVSLNSQSLSNLRTIQFDPSIQDQIKDSLTIIPSTIAIYSIDIQSIKDTISLACYQVDNHTIVIDTSCLSGKNTNLMATYRVFPNNLEKQASLIDSSAIMTKDRVIYVGYDFSPVQKSDINKLIRNDQLAYDGNFTRGFSVGNSQSLVLNSNFNLQLNGDLGDGMTVQAAISDDNLPIQAEGNTQLLQEFDKVFIKVNKDKTSIVAGDYDLNSPNGYFIKYFKKLKGLQLKNEADVGPYTVTNSGNFAISRGKFARNILPTREGNQGPYKLFGNEGERILKVLSGTEKVYLDGKLIKRGIDYDYIISYDRSEILFTTNLLITKDSRLIVEFEYADQNYLRSQYSIGSKLKADKFEVNIHFYNEQDSKTTMGDIDLAPADINILSLAGDDLSRTFRTGVIPSNTDFSQEQNYYNRVYEASIGDSILVFTADPDSARYIVTFSEVGSMQGSYEIDPVIAANGRAYKWIGNNMGSFEPIVRLIPPEKKQIMSINALSQVHKNLLVNGEVAISNVDINRFSGLDKNDNLGLAMKVGAKHDMKLGPSENFTLRSFADYEFVQNHFNALNPFRSAEFSRDWSIRSNERANENIYNLGVGLQSNNGNKLAYSLSGYARGNIYQGVQQDIDLFYNVNGYKIVSLSSLLYAEDESNNITFFRPNLRMEKKFSRLKNWTIGYYFEQEENKTSDLITKTLDPISFNYIINKYYIQNTNSQSFNFGISYNIRKDKLPFGEKLNQATSAKEIELFGKWYPSESSNLDWNFTVRSLDIDDASLTPQLPKRSYLGRVDYKLNTLNKGLKSNTSYVISSGQEAKAEFEYIRVEKGEGQFIWIDDGDGVEEVFEFQLSPVQDTANFIRVNIINNDFIRTLTNSLNQSIRLDLDNMIGDKTNDNGLNKFASKISTISNYRISQKTEDGDSQNDAFKPLSFSINDTTLVSYNLLVNNTLFFNRGHPIYDIQIGNRRNRNKQVFVTGFEANGLQEYFSRIRVNIKRNIDFILAVNVGENMLDSEYFDQNDYTISFLKIKPELTVRPNQEIRFVSSYGFVDKKNKLSGGETSTAHDFTFNTSWRKSNTSSLDAGVSFVLVNYNGPTNSNIELAILEGLKDGRNFLWNTSYSRKLSKYVELLISYEGRKTGTSRTIHTGRAQVKANF